MKRYLWSIIALLLLTSLACSALGGKSTPTSVPGGTTEPSGGTTEPSGGTTEPSGGTTEPSGGAIFTPPQDLSTINTYRIRTTLSEKYANGENTQLTLEQAYTREPRASHIKMTSTDSEQGEQSIEMIQIDTTQWLNMGGDWMQSEGEPVTDEFGSEILDTFNFASENPDDYEYLGKETIEGIRTKHYRVKESAALPLALEQGELQDVSEAKIEIWVADEANMPNMLIKVTYSIKGTHAEKGTAEIAMEQVTYDINANFTINKPEGVKTSIADDVPTYSGPMSNTFLMSGMASFETTDKPETVAAFYKDELPKQGWTLGSEETYEGTAMQTWNKDNRTLYVMINIAENGNTSVMLSLSEQ